MRNALRSAGVWIVLSGFTVSACAAELAAAKTSGKLVKPQLLTEKERALHALDRLTFGPRPGDLARVEAIGLDKWIDQQLHPGRIQDSQLDAMLSQMPAMQLTQAQLIAKFPPPPMLRNMEKTNTPLPTDPVEHAIYSNQIAYIRAQQKQNQKQNNVAAQTAPAMHTMQDTMADGTMASTETATIKPAYTQEAEAADVDYPNIAQDRVRLLALPPAQRFQALLSLTPGEPRKLFQQSRPAEKLALVEGLTPQQKEIAIALADDNRVVAGEEMEAKLLRDIYSERQLNEVMTDFWLNHFNVYVRKSGLAPWQIATYERDVIRPNALGNFETLLRAVATSPAMMEYLDNHSSIGPDSKAARWLSKNKNTNAIAAKIGDRGLNENYARELMELHTLGVNGGYTQRDVTEVAKVFTGWTIAAPRDGGQFEYMDRRHEPGDKIVLGKTIHEAGQQEGYEVLHILATSPATARFICTELAIRFVSDDPPPALVDAMAKAFLASHGDIRQVMQTMLKSPQFWSRDVYRAKVKTPLEYVVSAVRATDTDATHPQSLISALSQMGMPLYGMQPPTGYSNMADAWVSSAALLIRMNFGLALTSNKLPGLVCDLPQITGATGAAVRANPQMDEAQLETTLLNGVVSGKTHATVLTEMEKLPEQEQAANTMAKQVAAQAPPPMDPLDGNLVQRRNNAGKQRHVNMNVSLLGSTESSIAAGLLLGSPDFQRK